MTSRFGISLIALGVFLLFWVLRVADRPLYMFFTGLPDGLRRSTPFEDLRAILQAGACWRQGVNVYLPSACLGGGVYNYSPFLLRAAYLPIGPHDTAVGGVILCLMFFLSLGFLPQPSSLKEGCIRLVAVVSTTVFYALEQGNFDVAIFVMTVAGLLQVHKSRVHGYFGYAIFVATAAMKFYPIALMILVVRETPRFFAAIMICGLAAVLLFIALYARDIEAAITIIPSGPPFRATFGQIDIARGLNLLHLLTARSANHLLGHDFFRSGQVVVTLTSWLMSGFAIIASFFVMGRYVNALKAMEPKHLVFLIAGSAVIVFCFYAAQNVYYRAIFLLLTIPGLWRMVEIRNDLRSKALLAAVVGLLWEALFRDIFESLAHLMPHSLVFSNLPVLFWLFRECLWWWVIIQLGAVVLAFVTIECRRLGVEARNTWPLQIDETAKKL